MNTADTTLYMVLGTTAVFLPLLLYVLSLLHRSRQVRIKLEKSMAQSVRPHKLHSPSESKNEA